MLCRSAVKVLLFFLLSEFILAGTSSSSDGAKENHSDPLKIVRRVEDVSEDVEAAAVQGVITRLLPDHARLFNVTIDRSMEVTGVDTVQVSAVGGAVQVRGNSGVAASWGVLHYLKQYCNCHISWDGDQLALPSSLPDANFTITAKDRFRYYQNVCTVSYSSVWWQWPRWEREIDWMALNGVNLPLAFTGQEAVWRRVYLKFGLTDEELSEYFTGPAFLAWNRMGNLMVWGGPLPVTFMEAQELLQKKILSRMRELGMIPVLPCFAGHVPSALARVFPDANLTRQSAWNNFNDTYTRTYMLEPTDPLFEKIGVMFINEMKATYNYTDGVYNCDAYNEQTPVSSEPSYLAAVSSSIFGTLQAADANAVWLLQAWFLLYPFWTPDLAQAFLTAVPKGRLLLLDLAAEVEPTYSKYDGFYGHYFIFCMLNNIGSTDGLFGNVDMLLEKLAAARASNTSLVGTGLTMEGIDQNYIMYDLMLGLAWEEPPANISDWAALYSTRRYGSSAPQEAWRYLIKNVYNDRRPQEYHDRHIIMLRPSLNVSSFIWYPVSDLINAWDVMIGAVNATEQTRRVKMSGDCPESNDVIVPRPGQTNCGAHGDLVSFDDALPKQETFRHDLVDVTREVLQIFGGQVAIQLVGAYNASSYSLVKRMGATLDSVLQDLDDLLATSPKFLLGRWTGAAAALATNQQEEDLYVYNALNQISLWGPTDGLILDYAVKQWSGAIDGYTRPRWQVFVAGLLDAIKLNKTLDEDEVYQVMFKTAEEPFSLSTDTPYPTEPVGDSITTALKLYKKYRPAFTQAGIPVLSRVSSEEKDAVTGSMSRTRRPRATSALSGHLNSVTVQEDPLSDFVSNALNSKLNLEGILEPVDSWQDADYRNDQRSVYSNSADRILRRR